MSGYYQRLLTKSNDYRKIEAAFASLDDQRYRDTLLEVKASSGGGMSVDGFTEASTELLGDDEGSASYIQHIVTDFLTAGFETAWEKRRRDELNVTAVFEATLFWLSSLAVEKEGRPKAVSLWNSYRADINHVTVDLLDSDDEVTMIVSMPIDLVAVKQPGPDGPDEPLPLPAPVAEPEHAVLDNTIRPDNVLPVDVDAGDGIYRITPWNASGDPGN